MNDAGGWLLASTRLAFDVDGAAADEVAHRRRERDRDRLDVRPRGHAPLQLLVELDRPILVVADLPRIERAPRSACSASNPRSMCCADVSVRMKSPATTSSVSAPEICPTTSRRRRRWRSTPSEWPLPPSCRAARASARDARHAGHRPMTMPVTIGGAKREEEDAQIERRVEVAAAGRRRDRAARYTRALTHWPTTIPGDAAERRQQQAFGDHLPHEPAAAGAERRAHRHLALARASRARAAGSRRSCTRAAAPGRRPPARTTCTSGIASRTARIGIGRASGSGMHDRAAMP